MTPEAERLAKNMITRLVITSPFGQVRTDQKVVVEDGALDFVDEALTAAHAAGYAEAVAKVTALMSEYVESIKPPKRPMIEWNTKCHGALDMERFVVERLRAELEVEAPK